MISWPGRRSRRRGSENFIIYELHVGSFAGRNDTPERRVGDVR